MGWGENSKERSLRQKGRVSRPAILEKRKDESLAKTKIHLPEEMPFYDVLGRAPPGSSRRLIPDTQTCPGASWSGCVCYPRGTRAQSTSIYPQN